MRKAALFFSEDFIVVASILSDVGVQLLACELVDGVCRYIEQFTQLVVPPSLYNIFVLERTACRRSASLVNVQHTQRIDVVPRLESKHRWLYCKVSTDRYGRVGNFDQQDN